MDWTVERVAKLTELWQAGLSASQVARRLGGGLSRNAVIGKIHRLGLKARAIPSRPRSVAGGSSERARRPTAVPNVPRSLKRSDRVFSPKLAPADLGPTACIQTLTHGACRWPIGDPGEAEFGYCGRPNVKAGPYCEHHHRVAFRPPPQTDRRPKPMHSGSRVALLGARG